MVKKTPVPQAEQECKDIDLYVYCNTKLMGTV